ncbi:MAG: sporulation peptidase YabG [Bacilli bacterium]
MKIECGSLVTRNSYDNDIVFRVTEIIDDTNRVLLHGFDIRLEADAPLNDLSLVREVERLLRIQQSTLQEEQTLQLFQRDRRQMRTMSELYDPTAQAPNVAYFQLPGKVLHMDGDANYLKKCLDLYERLQVPAVGIYCKESEMPSRIAALMEEYNPDCIVLTGHDAYQKSKGGIDQLDAYRHSKHFVDAVRIARKKERSLDQLMIFAGACQSNFEAIIRAGANFASSPARINIHALDPVYVVSKVCFTSVTEQVNLWDLIRNTFTGEKGLGGVETRGLLRMGLPLGMYVETNSELFS